jgi:hypothetical protein
MNDPLNIYGQGGGAGGAGYQSGNGAGAGGTQSPAPKPAFSFNRFIVEPYLSDRQVKTATATGGTGFAMIQQKVSLKGLRLLVEFRLDSTEKHYDGKGNVTSIPTVIPAGSIVYIKEELLHTQAWAKQILESPYIGKFMIVDKQHIEFIQPL